MSDFADAFLADYFAECEEHMTAIHQALLSLEGSIGAARPDPRVLEELFRGYHSLKGLAGMVEDRDAEALSHEMESYLRALRDGDAVLSSVGVDALIDGTRTLEQAIAARQRREAPPNAAAVLATLKALAREPGQALTPSSTPDIASPSQWSCVFTPSIELSNRGITVNTVRDRLSAAGTIRRATPQVHPDGSVQFHFVINGPFDQTVTGAWRDDGMICAVTDDAPPIEEDAAPPLLQEITTNQATHYVRVDLVKLDDLMRMIGDMVICRARLTDALAKAERHVPAAEWRTIQESAAALERQLRDLRDGIMRVRLVPVGEIFRRMPFVVRDLAREADRRVHVVLSGQDTQIDKFLVERMMDPVLHLVRNAVSHGLEPAAERIAAGKRPDGRISLSARATGEVVTLEISDDGRGVAVDQVEARAHKAGLAVPRRGDLDDDALLDLLCAPGFSTRDEADRVSGRGFGMAVVRKTVHELGGTLRLASTPGQGTRFTIELPLTLAITDALITTVGSQTYAVPQSAVREVIEVDLGEIRALQSAEVIPFRGEALPVVRLARTLGITADERSRGHALVIGSGAAAVGLLVDRVLTQREIVVRSTVDPLLNVEGIAGATDLGDGRAVLILDVVALTRRSARQSTIHDHSRGIA